MRSVLLTGDAVGGVWRYSLDLARGLIARGVTVTLAVLGPQPSAAQLDEAAEVSLPMIDTGLPLDWTAADARTLRSTGAELAGLAARLRVERVQLHAPALAAEVAWSVPVVAVAHSDVGTWWHALHGSRLPHDLAWRAVATAHGLAEADAVIAPTHAFAAALDRRYRPERPIIVVHNGLAAATAAQVPRRTGVLAAGRLWDPAKNAALLDRLAPRLGAPVEAAGPLTGPQGQTASLPCLTCLGPLSRTALAERMAARTVFASAARYEPFGLAVLEAAQAGMALALSDIPSHRELWDGAALFFHPEDDGAARDALRRLLAAPDAFAARARDRAQRYSAEKMVASTLAVHRSLDRRAPRNVGRSGLTEMRVAIFAHSLVSCWNHGNAHFLRGVTRALLAEGHAVRVHEPENAWSVANLRADHGDAALQSFARDFPDLAPRPYAPDADIAALLQDADLVLVHEWNDPWLVAQIGRSRRCGGQFTLLFHDTHHRAVSDPAAIRRFDLSAYDGVLAFGATLAEVYRRWGWGDRVFVWHEAADVALFQPPAQAAARDGLVWVGNWGDGERGAELVDYLLAPARAAGLTLDVHGVRYPAEARTLLGQYGACYRGWLANARAPTVYAAHLATVHVPRRFYVRALPGIPTIRVFEALACGIPLLSAPWDDCEALFRVGTDFLMAADGPAMAGQMRTIAHDPARRDSLVAHGLETIRARHTCAHRAAELLAIARRLGAGVTAEVA